MEIKILAEPSEVDKLTCGNLPIIKRNELEEMTGADFLITPLSAPFVPALFEKHFSAGAVLVQMKRGHDFPASIIDGRINHSLAKMREIVGKSAQRIVLFQGIATRSTEGEKNLIIDGRLVKMGYERVMSWAMFEEAVTGISGKGGVFAQIPNSTYLEDWCINRLSKISKMLKEPEKELYGEGLDKSVFVEEDNLLQDVRLIPNAYKVFAQMDGIGPKLVKVLREAYGNNYGLWLAELTNPALVSDLPGIGKGKLSGVRNMFALKPWQSLGVINYPQLMSEYGGFDEERCAECPHRGKAEYVKMGEGLVFCDQKCDKKKGS